MQNEENNVIKVDLSNQLTNESAAETTEVVEQQEETPSPVQELVVEEVKEEIQTTPVNDSGDYVINLNPEADAVQQVQGESEESVLRDERVEETIQPEEGSSPLEIVNEEETPVKPIEEQQPVVQELIPDLPENVDKLVKFMKDTGGSVEDFVSLNRDISSYDDDYLIKEYYKDKKPHLDEEDINFLINKNIKYDEEYDDEEDVRAKKLAKKELLFEAKNYFEGEKDRYYADIKLKKQTELPPEVQEATEFYSSYKQNVKNTEDFNKDFHSKTNQLFSDEFKGFEFKVGESNYRFKADPEKTNKSQSDFNNVFNQYYDKKTGLMNDVKGYHKALFSAQNSDRIAQHFYEQGRADAVKQSAKNAKNIDMSPRADSGSNVNPSGTGVKVVSNNSQSTFGTKLKIKGWN